MAQFPPNPRIGLGIVCAIAGGTAGYFLFFWIARQGFYALILPSTLLGLAGGAGVRLRSNSFAIACGAAGLVLALFTEWRFAPFVVDPGFGYFITNIPRLKPITLVMIAICPIISYRLALGIDDRSAQSSTPPNVD